MSERNYQLTLTTPPQAQYAKGHMLNIQGDTAAELNVAIEEAREIQSLAPFFVGVPELGPVPTPEQAVAAVTQTFQAQPVTASSPTVFHNDPLPAPVAQPAVTPVAVATPPASPVPQPVPAPSAEVGPPCAACGATKVKKNGSKGIFWSCPNWRSNPAPNTLQHSQN